MQSSTPSTWSLAGHTCCSIQFLRPAPSRATGDPASLTCSVCSLEFEDKERLRLHSRIHTVQDCIKCHKKHIQFNKISHHRKICGKESAAPSVLSCDHPG